MWVKICGIRDTETAGRIAEFEPDAIGLNFYRGTPRHVDEPTATQIAASLPSGVDAVGLFVDESAERVHTICRSTRVTTVQLHGDEPVELLQQLAACDDHYRLIRAWRLGAEGFGPLGEYLHQLAAINVRPFACLIDARVAGKHGGTGKTVDWGFVNREYHRADWPPLILAGGLTPENVAEAIHTVQPWGVDVASGVESSPGVKDLDLVERFITQARAAT